MLQVLPQLLRVEKFDLDYIPHTAAYGQHGHIVIRDSDSRKLHVHDCEGRHIRTVTPEFNVSDITSFQDKFYVTEQNTDDGRVFVYNSQLELMNTIIIKIGYKASGCVAVTDQFVFVTRFVHKQLINGNVHITIVHVGSH